MASSIPTEAGPRAALKTAVVFHILTAAAWIVTLVWALQMGMGLWGMPGTMGLSIGPFVTMWGIMMVAMMLGSVAPLAGLYARTVRASRVPRLAAFGAGYALIWTATGVVAYFVADSFEWLATEQPGAAQAVAVAAFAGAGLYQLTPLKFRCLSHCRTPFGHLMHYLGFRGPIRDLRAGIHHGLFCLGCCWALMGLMVAFGVMNIAAMAGLALVIGIEKQWRHGERFARLIGVATCVYALVIVFNPTVAPGLDPTAVMTIDMGMGGKNPIEQWLSPSCGVSSSMVYGRWHCHD